MPTEDSTKSFRSKADVSRIKQNYEEKFGRFQFSAVFKGASLMGESERLLDDMETAVQTGEPIPSWHSYMHTSPVPLAPTR